MNRKQRRNFGKKVGQMDITRLKDTLFRAILASSDSELDKIFAMSENVLEKVLFPRSIRGLGSGQIYIRVYGVRPHKEKINISKEIINKTRGAEAPYVARMNHTPLRGEQQATVL